MIKTIQKIKAAVSHLMEESNIDIGEVKEKYYEMCELILNDTEETFYQ